MSDGKMKDPQSEALSAFEIIHGMERKCSALDAKVQEHDSYGEKIQEIRSNLKDVSAELEFQKSSINQSIRSLIDVHGVLGRKIDDSNTKSAMFSSDLEKHRKDHLDLKAHYQDHKDEVDLHTKRIYSLLDSSKAQSVSKSDFLDHKTDVECNFIQLSAILQSHQERLAALDSRQSAMSTKIQSLLENAQEAQEKVAVLEKGVSSLTQQMSLLASSIDDRFSFMMADVQQKLARDLKSFASGFEGKQADVDSMHSSVKDKMDSLILEVNNNSLRTYNYEQQLKNLERKVENLQLLLKKYELSQ